MPVSRITPKSDMHGSVSSGIIADHERLWNRDEEDQHPIAAITGLQEALDSKVSGDNFYTKKETDEKITAATTDMATMTWTNAQGFLKQADLTDYRKAADQDVIDTAITASILGEVSRATEAETALDGKITSEKERAQGVESTLLTAIETEKDRATNAETTLATSIANEATRAATAEALLETNKQNVIPDLDDIRSKANTALQPSALDNYYTKTETDTNISNAVTAEAQTRAENDDALVAAIKDEEKARELAISSEAYAREAGDLESLRKANKYTDTKVGEEKTARETADNTLTRSVGALEESVEDLGRLVSGLDSSVTTINSKIPEQATKTNQLADKAFVNSSIQAMAADYITADASGNAFATRAALLAGPYYHAGSTVTPKKNDYAIVVNDETHDNKQCRYLYQDAWNYQYSINTTFTAAQQAAIDSGITSEKVVQITTNTTNISSLTSDLTSHTSNTNNPHEVTKAQVGLGNVDNTSDLDKPISTATQNALNGKQDIISDLSTIRSGAALGATAVQPSAISDMATKTWTNDQGFLKEHQSLAAYRKSVDQDVIDAGKQNLIKDSDKISLTDCLTEYRKAAVQDAIDATKLDKDQGSTNVGKVLTVGSTGEVAPESLPTQAASTVDLGDFKNDAHFINVFKINDINQANGNIVNLKTKTTYNAETNKLVTEADLTNLYNQILALINKK